jgi:heat shock protein HtpX
MFIVNPLSGQKMMSLFSTHPPLNDRIARLRGFKGPEDTTTTPNRKNGMNPDQGKAFWDRLSG